MEKFKTWKTWYEVTTTFDSCTITGTVFSLRRPVRNCEGDKSFDYFLTKKKADEYVWGFYHA